MRGRIPCDGQMPPLGDWKVRNLAADILYHPYKAHVRGCLQLYIFFFGDGKCCEQVMIGNRDELKGNQDRDEL